MYDSTELKATKSKLTSHLAGHVPAQPYGGAVRLIVNGALIMTVHGTGTANQNNKAGYG